MERKYIVFNEAKNAIDYLCKVPKFLDSTTQNRRDWKWVVISLHGALYGLGICCLRGTDPSLLLKGGKLKPLGDILKMCQRPVAIRTEQKRTQLELTEDEKKSIDRLKEIRNSFTHYSPCAWYLSESLLIDIAKDALKVLEKTLPSISPSCSVSKNQHRQIRSAIHQSHKILKSYPRDYNSNHAE